MQLGAVRPSHDDLVRPLASEGVAESNIYALHAGLSQSYADAIHDGLVARSPCSHRT